MSGWPDCTGWLLGCCGCRLLLAGSTGRTMKSAGWGCTGVRLAGLHWLAAGWCGCRLLLAGSTGGTMKSAGWGCTSVRLAGLHWLAAGVVWMSTTGGRFHWWNDEVGRLRLHRCLVGRIALAGFWGGVDVDY